MPRLKVVQGCIRRALQWIALVQRCSDRANPRIDCATPLIARVHLHIRRAVLRIEYTEPRANHGTPRIERLRLRIQLNQPRA